MPYCPNCSSEVDVDSHDCSFCGAIFGEGGSWRPVSERPHLKGKEHKKIQKKSREISWPIHWDLLNASMPFSFFGSGVFFFIFKWNSWALILLIFLCLVATSYWVAVKLNKSKLRRTVKFSMKEKIGHSIILIANLTLATVTIWPITLHLLGGGGDNGLLLIWYAVPIFTGDLFLWPIGYALAYGSNQPE